MSWAQDIGAFIKKLILLETRVESNAEDIKALREDMKKLIEFTQRVSYAVKRNEERAGDRYENLVLTLKLELSNLEKRLHLPSQLNGSTQVSLGQQASSDKGKFLE